MNMHVIQHHIYHTNGFNPDNIPSELNSAHNWHLYHHTFINPPFNPNSHFNRQDIFNPTSKPAPIYQYTFIYDPSIEPKPESQKTDELAKEQLVPQASIQNQNKQDSEPVTKDTAPTIAPKETSTILEESLLLIQKNKAALNNAFAELEQKNTSTQIFKGILKNRQVFWNELAKQAVEAEDLELEIKKQRQLDVLISMLLNEEVDISQKQKVPIKSPLGLIASYQNQDLFIYRLETACETSDLPPLSEAEKREANEEIIKILFTLEKKENAAFIHSLSKFEERFAMRGYPSVADHYRATILAFKQIDDTLLLKQIEDYINEWNGLLKEFDPQHQLLIKLHEADLALEEFAKTMQKQLDAIDEKLAGDIFQDINDLTDFMKERETLKSSVDIAKYTQNIYAFIQQATEKLQRNTNSLVSG